ncbi:MAG: LysE family translocator [Terasakiella sp.]|uniref:LysE family translocator n=1 Tax=unclassified Terasakiella TaxID=2614952 RepID=UPI003B0077A7
MTLFLAMTSFAMALSISPGPVNMVTLVSGVNNGVMRTLPFVIGACVGFTALLYMTGVGTGALLQNYPRAMDILHFGGTAFIFYMGVRIAFAKGSLEKSQARLPKFYEGFLLQWLNPKAWIACLSGIGAFASGENEANLTIFCVLYFFICSVGVGFWAVLGAGAQHFLDDEKRLQIFNRMMGAILCVVATYLFFEI